LACFGAARVFAPALKPSIKAAEPFRHGYSPSSCKMALALAMSADWVDFYPPQSTTIMIRPDSLK